MSGKKNKQNKSEKDAVDIPPEPASTVSEVEAVLESLPIGTKLTRTAKGWDVSRPCGNSPRVEYGTGQNVVEAVANIE